MNQEQREEWHRLSQQIPKFAEVLAELQTTGPQEKFWLYYYPLCYKTCVEFFKDEEIAREAVLPLFERWTRVATKYDRDNTGYLRLFNKASHFFCLNFQRDTSYGPELVYQSEEDVEEMTDEDVREVYEAVVAFTEEYPPDGIDHNDPETLAIQAEDDSTLAQRVSGIRASLFPGDQAVYDLVLENYNSDEIANILERSVKSVSNAITRIRAATVNAG